MWPPAQFYWSPQDVIDRALEFAGLWNLREWRNNPPEPFRILEPSCGDGRIMDAIRLRGHRVFGIEYHSGRAAEARAKGQNVLTANFLEQPSKAEFDMVVMNPPFYGRHYVNHVRHALEFLKPGIDSPGNGALRPWRAERRVARPSGRLLL